MFPISDSIKARRFPWFNLSIIATTVFVFIKEILSPDTDVFIKHYALVPSHVDFNNVITLLPFVTAIFLHGGILHILSNLWFLWVFGDNVEGYLPRWVFLTLYFVAGVVGNFVQFLFMPHSSIPLLGASGAIAGVLGCYYVLFPYAKVRTVIFILFFFTIVNLSAPIILGYWFVLQIISGVLTLPGMGSTGGVAFFAHIAGFLVGVIIGTIYKKRQSAEIVLGSG